MIDRIKDIMETYLCNGFVVCCIILLAVSIYNLCKPKEVHNNGNAIDQVRESIGSASKDQRSISDGIQNAENQVDRIIREVEGTENKIADAGRIIEECKSILADVRRNGTEKD